MAIDRNGHVLRGTLRNLEQGVRSSPMERATLAAVEAQAVSFTDRIVESYGTQVAGGEVGLHSSGRAGEGPIVGSRPPRALLYGRVQSGKTVAMILTSALALDNGFKIVVVLTTDNTALVKQTAARFKDLSGPEVLSTARDGISYQWEGQENQLRDFMDTEGMVLVCSKNAYNLPHVIRFLQQIDARLYPVLILDDEADAATPDTTLAARAASRPNAPSMPSTINRLLIENPDPQNLGLSLGEVLPHSFYVQVTATPNVLLLQTGDAQIRPTMTHLLVPGEGYCGGEEFFGDFDMRLNQPQPHTIVLIDDTAALMRRDVPPGLADSLDFFILSACSRALEIAAWPRDGFKHLSHTSHLIGEHELVAGHIATHLIRVRRVLRRSPAEVEAYFAKAYVELGRSTTPQPFADLMPELASALENSDVIRVNATTDEPSYGPRLNFLVGGNILGRGLTIDDLLVTYYIREAKVPQMDTVWQHARMYGYRRLYIQYMRVYLPHRIGVIFRQLQLAEEELRIGLGSNADDTLVLIRVPRPTRPTRPNALDATTVRMIPAGRDQINPHYIKIDPAAAVLVRDLLVRLGVPVSEPDRTRRATPVALDAAYDLIASVAIEDDEPGFWQPDVVAALMRNFQEEFGGECKVYVRPLARTELMEGRSRARLAGPEVAIIQQAGAGAPVLVLLHLGSLEAPEGWYPTLVMPRGTPAYQFNRVRSD